MRTVSFRGAGIIYRQLGTYTFHTVQNFAARWIAHSALNTNHGC